MNTPLYATWASTRLCSYLRCAVATCFFCLASLRIRWSVGLCDVAACLRFLFGESTRIPQLYRHGLFQSIVNETEDRNCTFQNCAQPYPQILNVSIKLLKHLYVQEVIFSGLTDFRCWQRWNEAFLQNYSQIYRHFLNTSSENLEASVCARNQIYFLKFRFPPWKVMASRKAIYGKLKKAHSFCKRLLWVVQKGLSLL